MRPAFLHPRFVIPGAVAAALVVWRVPIDGGPLATVLTAAFVCVFVAVGLHSIWDLVTGWRTPAATTPPVQTVTGLRASPVPPAAPALDAAAKVRVDAIVALLARTGVFMPSAPAPHQLYEAVADQGEPITQGTVLMALHEASYHHPEFEGAGCMANLAFHDTKAEQFEDMLQRQIADLVRLSRGALVVTDIAIALDLADGTGPHPDCTIRMRVNGSPLSVTYAPAAKYLSTHLHVALANAMRAAAPSLRLAWYWTEQGVWMSAITEEAMELLLHGPGSGEDSGEEWDWQNWDWVDQGEPIAAGEFRSR